MSDEVPLRPYVAADLMALRELYASSIEELTQDDYTEDQRVAWVSAAADADVFGKRLASQLTLVAVLDGEHAGFASLIDGTILDMLYVHPHHAELGVGAALTNALETIAAARGAGAITVEASDTAVGFFEARGYVPAQRNLRPLDDEWLSNTTMTKPLKARAEKSLS